MLSISSKIASNIFSSLVLRHNAYQLTVNVYKKESALALEKQ